MAARTLGLVLVALAAAAFGERASLAADRGLVAVLPLDFQNSKFDKPTQVSLEEALRNTMGRALGPLKYTVLTGETTLSILEQNGVDVAKVCEASCALDAARELKAKLFISGTVVQTDGHNLTFIRLFDSASGKMLSSVRFEAKDSEDMRHQIEAHSSMLTQPLYDDANAGFRTGKWVALGGAVAAAGVGAFLITRTISAAGDSDKATTPAAYNDARSSANSSALGASTAFGIAGGAAITGVVLWILGNRSAQ